MHINEFYLSTAYLGNIQYFSKFVAAEKIYIEKYENYIKQSFRNRCEILAANGKLALVVPVEHSDGNKITIHDVRISYAQDWQKQHWRALTAAYGSSPFFEYYCDDLIGFYENKEKFLFDFNIKTTQKILDLMGINKQILFTDKYKTFDKNFEFDHRQNITPKMQVIKHDKTFFAQQYYQVFAQKFGFIQNLSIVDLLFNEGPNAADELKKCII